jgi:uroporphyrinogen-III synthase
MNGHKTVVLTHSCGRFAGLSELLTANGFEVLQQPLIRTEPLRSAVAGRAVEQLAGCRWLLFGSPAAVTGWLALSGLAGWSGLQSGPLLGAVGAATAAALRRAGLNVQLVAQQETAEGLADAFLADPACGGPVGLPRGDRSLDTLADRLTAAGISTRQAVVYRTIDLQLPPGLVADVVLLASPSAVANLPAELATASRLVAVGPVTAASIRQRGLACTSAERPAAAELLRAIQEASSVQPARARRETHVTPPVATPVSRSHA